ncbi:hypothetical protein ACK8P5_19225 [Paenibacillus sp. EC2-1]|uniref:hypothetical protein n=1 Tax=Paenibacillus sp. EC2-1 TaxID=3388665 RepID=UPI003BEEDEA9
MNTKKTQISILVLISILLFTGCTSSKSSNVPINDAPKYIIADAKVISYEDFDEIDSSAELIIKGKKTSEKEVITQKDEEGYPTDNRTISVIKIEEVLKDTNQYNLNNGDDIIVQENAALDNNVVYSTAGYQLMNKDEEYLLFLSPNLTQPKVFNIKGVYHGKIPIPSNEKSLLNEDIDNIEYKGDQDELLKLKNIFSEALEKYNK